MPSSVGGGGGRGGSQVLLYAYLWCEMAGSSRAGERMGREGEEEYLLAWNDHHNSIITAMAELASGQQCIMDVLLLGELTEFSRKRITRLSYCIIFLLIYFMESLVAVMMFIIFVFSMDFFAILVLSLIYQLTN